MTTHKKIGLILGALVLLIAAGTAYSRFTESKSRPYPTSASHETTNPNASTGTTSATTTQGTPSTKVKTYTLAEVATHKDASSCWTTINGNVYDVTSWISQHPGGQQAILGLCGIDGSDAFNGQHGGQARPASELASFKIGILTQ